MALTVYGIQTCEKVRKARRWLDANGHPHDFVDFRQSPPSEAKVAQWIARLGSRPLRNSSGSSYRALGPERDAWTDSEWTSAFAADPMLIKRPIVERDGVPVQVGFDENVGFALLRAS